MINNFNITTIADPSQIKNKKKKKGKDKDKNKINSKL